MSHSDIEKGAGTSTYVQQPQNVHVEHRTTFLPTYEEQLNENLRNFGQPDGQNNVTTAFDLIQEPKAGRRKCMKREYLILAIILLLICAVALPLGLVFIIRNNHSDQEVKDFNSTTLNMTKTDSISLQPSTLQTRQAETSSNVTPVTAVFTSTVVPVTVYVTMTPTPEISTPTITVTRTQSTSTSTSTSDPTPPPLPSTITTLSIITATPSSTSSTLSKFSLNPALNPSIESELAAASSSSSSSQSAEKPPATPTTNTKETTTATVVSATTIEPEPEVPTPTPAPTTASKALQTAEPRFGFCGVAGSNC
ncbi:hypothetical protein CERZMDRAFT_100142 [Cercospora zeae-maydis SCOH1-5]|uniref:Uncharacterized protein n=1 Tax=Cercospora zeae-maydis SCOH1-5 TaxID=717836 RepID=A0A6A6F7D5_9PEZI|nr:hypothetical protein CERZMDRAFT_100142 [Cercospora zeae-maydis SCOH1-5]